MKQNQEKSELFMVFFIDGNQWKEKRTTVELDFFRDNSLENCGMSLSQDKYGIRTEILVAGKRPRADAASVIPRLKIFGIMIFKEYLYFLDNF